MPRVEVEALVIGGGPGGSSAAYHLARAGVRVLLIEKERFPREKVCGDGLTPRAVRALEAMGIRSEAKDFFRVEGLRIRGGDVVLEFPWPSLPGIPPYGLVAERARLDSLLLARARQAGAEVWEGARALCLLRDGEEGPVAGARVAVDGEPVEARAGVVVAACGAGSALVRDPLPDRDPAAPVGVAARAYYPSGSPPRWLESFLDLRASGRALPGYGWIFPLPGGRVNVGVGLLARPRPSSLKGLLASWVATLPSEFGVEPRPLEPPRSGPLPMGGTRPPAAPGLLLVGDAAGMVNPFTGEGIAYALESGALAAMVAREAVRSGQPGLARLYRRLLKDRYGGYFTMGRIFLKVLAAPRVMDLATRYGLPRRRLMYSLFKVMANLFGPEFGREEGILERVSAYFKEHLPPPPAFSG